MLSDACSNYLASDDTVIGAVRQLALDVEHYSDPLFDYPRELIDALAKACENVLDHGDVASVERLDRLATSVMRFLDSPLRYSDWRPMIVDKVSSSDDGTAASGTNG